MFNILSNILRERITLLNELSNIETFRIAINKKAKYMYSMSTLKTIEMFLQH